VAVGCAAQVREVEELAQIQRQQHAPIVRIGPHKLLRAETPGDLTISLSCGFHGSIVLGGESGLGDRPGTA